MCLKERRLVKFNILSGKTHHGYHMRCQKLLLDPSKTVQEKKANIEFFRLSSKII